MQARREALVHRVRCAFAGSDGWVWLPGPWFSVRWAQELETPSWARERSRGAYPYWDAPTYRRLVFVTLVGAPATFSVLLRVSRCPWVEARDSSVSLSRALGVLEDPEGVF